MDRIIGNDFEKEIKYYLHHIYNGIILKKNGQDYYATSVIQEDIKKLDSIFQETKSLQQTIDAQAAMIQSLQQALEIQVKTIEEQNSIIKRQHENILRYENDVIYKTQKYLIMELIGIADNLRNTLNECAKEKDFDSLYKSMEDLTEWVDASLQTVAVRKHESTDTKELDRKRQEIVEIQETQDADEDGMIKSLLPGYIWSVPMVGSNEFHDGSERPKLYEFMIRPEQVARLRYVGHADSSHEQEVHDINDEKMNAPCTEIETSMEESQSQDSSGQQEINNMQKISFTEEAEQAE